MSKKEIFKEALIEASNWNLKLLDWPLDKRHTIKFSIKNFIQIKNMENTFEPRKSISERYSLENMAKQRGVDVEEFKVEIDKQLKMKQDIIDKLLLKGWTQEQSETHALRCLYIDGFSGPTFKD